MFLKALASHGSSVLQPRIEACAQTIRNIKDSNTIEFGLQAWPVAAMEERENLEVLLIGISSSHKGTWTHDQRPAPEYPKPDAWIYVPGKILLVFEFKNDEHPLDATQISAYAHYLKLFPENDDVPQANAGEKLNSAGEAKKVQNACANLVLDTSWSTVVEALSSIQQQENVDGMGRWLCGQAADYVKWHVFPPYRGIKTIMDWLNGPDTSDRRNHLRRLIGKMGDTLASSAACKNAITFARNQSGNWDLAPGDGSAVYVKLERNGKLQQRDFLGKNISAVLWFQFTGDESKRIGLEYHMEASGCISNGNGVAGWNEASKRSLDCAKNLENLLAQWIPKSPNGCEITVSAVKFKGNKKNWHSGGCEDQSPDAPNLIQTTPQIALEFLKTHREKLWCFPRVGPGEECATVQDAAVKVCKPALSLLADTSKITSCGENAQALQSFLQKAIESISS
jgi:hypothetical protein